MCEDNQAQQTALAPRSIGRIIVAAFAILAVLAVGVVLMPRAASTRAYVYDGHATMARVSAGAGLNGDSSPGVRLVDVVHGYDDSSNLARTNARAGDYALAPETRSLYRAVSTAEAEELASVGRFRAGPNPYEGKLFATTAEDAARFGRISDALIPGGLPFHIVETRVPSSVASSFESLTTDGMSAVHVAEGQLGALNAAGRWSIWDYVPWAAKP